MNTIKCFSFKSSLGILLVSLCLPALQAYAAGTEYDELMHAISSSDTPKAIEILGNPEKVAKINLNEKREDQWNPLLLASALGNHEVVQSLLNQKVDLNESIRVQNIPADKFATPFILAAQNAHPEVMALILNSAKFTPEQLQQEVRNALSFKQVALAEQLMKLNPGKPHTQSGAEASSSCDSSSSHGFSPIDLKAQFYQTQKIVCAVCTGVPGEETSTRLIDGSQHTGNSVATDCCGQYFCEACVVGRVEKCPLCRHGQLAGEKFSTQLISNGIPAFKWDATRVGSSKILLPGQHAPAVASSSHSIAPIASSSQDPVQGRGGVLDSLGVQFMPIPAGRLPNGTQVAAFEADRYPVTRGLWNEIMEGKPHAAPGDQVSWISQPNLPVTHVNWENENGSPAEVQDFLTRLNQRAQAQGDHCTYDLPTDAQLQYMIRGDVTGNNTARFSVARDAAGNLVDVTDANVNQYVTHSGNSNYQIQPVGSKAPNAFGIELGNVWKMSKDLYHPSQPNYGRSVRGGSWATLVSFAESGFRGSASAGYRYGGMGFALVKTCP